MTAATTETFDGFRLTPHLGRVTPHLYGQYLLRSVFKRRVNFVPSLGNSSLAILNQLCLCRVSQPTGTCVPPLHKLSFLTTRLFMSALKRSIVFYCLVLGSALVKFFFSVGYMSSFSVANSLCKFRHFLTVTVCQITDK